MGRPCVSGAGGLRIDYRGKAIHAGSDTVREGELLTIDGSTGAVMLGEVDTVQPALSGDLGTLMGWAGGPRTLRMHANAATQIDDETERVFVRVGLGLRRPETTLFATN